MKKSFVFLKEVIQHFGKSNTFEKGAALAYYTVFSFLPMIVILISLLGLFFGEKAVSGEISAQLKGVIGADGATGIENLLKQQHLKHNSLWTSILGFVTLALSATGMFNQLQSAFNAIWELKPKPKSSLLRYLFNHLTSFAILLMVGFTLLITTTINSILNKYTDTIPPPFEELHLLEHGISFLLVALMFAVMFKFLGDAVVAWKPALMAGVFTSVLFIIGKTAIGLYIGHSHIGSTFGGASVLAVLMLWVYYTSQIIFLGACFLKVMSDQMGCPVLPDENAVKVLEQEVLNEE